MVSVHIQHQTGLPAAMAVLWTSVSLRLAIPRPPLRMQLGGEEGYFDWYL